MVVYISEAHPQDLWPLGQHVCLNAHKTIEDRIEAAQMYKEKFNLELPLVVDSMENEFDGQYAAWPERFFVIESGKMSFIGMPSEEDEGFSKGTLDLYLASVIATQNMQLAVVPQTTVANSVVTISSTQ